MKHMDNLQIDDRPLITIIVPVYNIIEYLPRCVRSLTAQTYTNLEIILVDDGSDDGTGELCDKLAEEDTRIKVFHKENGGSSSARNLGLKNASGKYVGFVDSDDYVDSSMYEKLYEGICRYNVRMAQIGRDELDAQGVRLPNICEPPISPVCIESQDFLRELLMHRGDCSFCTKLTDIELLQSEAQDADKEEIFPVGRLNEDFELLIRLLPKIDRLLSLPEQTYHVFYRIGSNSRKADRENFPRVYGDCVDNADKAARLVNDSYPALREEALRFGVFQRLEYLLHIPISRMTSDNKEYRNIVRWMRKNILKGLMNSHLTVKNKLYHVMFAISPRGIRKIHRMIRLRKDKGNI
jgi:glycosyltransferase involved in cell wall biosynthesis